MRDLVIEKFEESIRTKQRILKDNEMINRIVEVSDVITEAIRNGNKIVLCGNGGSASDALHFAGEIVGRFQEERKAWPAVVLNADVATMTAIANDYGYERVFSRQAEAHINKGDVFIGISTSGNSKNIIEVLPIAKERGAKTVGFLGKDGGILSKEVDFPIIVPNNNTARIQESHITIIHILCDIVERNLKDE